MTVFLRTVVLYPISYQNYNIFYGQILIVLRFSFFSYRDISQN